MIAISIAAAVATTIKPAQREELAKHIHASVASIYRFCCLIAYRTMSSNRPEPLHVGIHRLAVMTPVLAEAGRSSKSAVK